MGGTTFYVEQEEADPNRAFERAHERAAFEHGHRGYTGTIAEKPGFVVIQRQPVTRAEATNMAAALLDANDGHVKDKWGDAGAIPFTDDGTSRQVKVAVVLKGEQAEGNGTRGLIADAARAQVKLHRGERVTDVTSNITRMDPDAPTVVRKVETVVTKPPSVTVYQVNGEGSYGSQAQARAAAVERAQAVVDEGRAWGPTTFVVTGKVARATGEPLVTVRAAVVKATYTATVTITAVPENPTVRGWLFFGWASC